jgi:hypothetical protein
MARMVDRYDEAVTALYRAPFAAFVAERKRLAGELKASGDKGGALRLGKLTRPTIAAWAVNQLWWTAPEDFEALFAAAHRLREGDLSGTEARREAIGKLRTRATTLLAQANQATSEATLRRIATTLSALAAAGSFAPDAPGQLVQDRDPPGFESAGSVERAPARPLVSPRQRELDEARRQGELSEARHQREDEEAREKAAAVERRRLEEQRARQRADRERLEHSLRNIESDIERRVHDLERMRRDLIEAENQLEKSRSTARQIEARLASSSKEK